MIKKYLIVILLFIVFFRSFAQNIETYLENQQPLISVLKLYLHTDREFYFIGDTIWFSSYLVEGKSNIPVNGACNLYVDLINSKGDILNKQILPLVNGYSPGWISLDNTEIDEGSYLLRAYIDHHKNFGDCMYFNKRIQVSGIKNSFELEEAKSNQTIPNKIDVSFLPEGGFLLADVPNIVSFKAVDSCGFGIDISGKLYDDSGEQILNFKTIYKGCGKLFFQPKPGKSYFAKIDGYPGLEFLLDKVHNTGTKININKIEKDNIPVIIQTKGENNFSAYYLICMYRSEGIFSYKIDESNLNTVIKIEVKQMREGINRFVLLDNNLNAISERLVFVKDGDYKNCNIQLNAQSYKTREEVKVKLIPPDSVGAERGKISIAVIDENYVNASGISQNIKSYLLLDSELKGYIENPADYFIDDEKLSSDKKLDLLMTVNGWSNYIWNNLNTDTLLHHPKFGFTVNGKVNKRFGTKALKEGNVSLVLFKKDSTTMFFDQELDSLGEFEFKNIVIYDSVSVFSQARNKWDNHNIKFEMEFQKEVPPIITKEEIILLTQFSEIPVSLYRQRYLNEMQLKEYYPDKNNILIEEVEITAKKPKPKYKTGPVMKNNGAHKLEWDDSFGYGNIIDYLANNVPGVTRIYEVVDSVRQMSVSIFLGGNSGSPGFFIDGYRYITIGEAKAYNIRDFEAIEIITPPMSNIYGARAINGAVILTTKTGNYNDYANIPLMGGVVEKINGFAPYREFYSPGYTPKNIHFEKPDYRNTLYWNPYVEVKDSAEVSFYSCDNLSRYRIFVEGISDNGKIYLGSTAFDVNEKNPSYKEESYMDKN